mmetsp:Transcript_2288/g.5680  ORF Transcript_2288/g.5680 Transcript_2288/m.5680 type:complete len:296 (+) Transcript_2288:1-888(+)
MAQCSATAIAPRQPATIASLDAPRSGRYNSRAFAQWLHWPIGSTTLTSARPPAQLPVQSPAQPTRRTGHGRHRRPASVPSGLTPPRLRSDAGHIIGHSEVDLPITAFAFALVINTLAFALFVGTLALEAVLAPTAEALLIATLAPATIALHITALAPAAEALLIATLSPSAEALAPTTASATALAPAAASTALAPATLFLTPVFALLPGAQSCPGRVPSPSHLHRHLPWRHSARQVSRHPHLGGCPRRLLWRLLLLRHRLEQHMLQDLFKFESSGSIVRVQALLPLAPRLLSELY